MKLMSSRINRLYHRHHSLKIALLTVWMMANKSYQVLIYLIESIINQCIQSIFIDNYMLKRLDAIIACKDIRPSYKFFKV